MALYGVDVSSYQGVGTGDGNDLVICKATEGGAYVDPTCDGHYQRAKSKGQLRGVYHFARPDLNPNGAIEEADFFVNNIKGYIKDAILVLDWECATWNVAWAKQWLDRVYSKTGVRPLIYMSASVVTSYDWSSVAKANYGLWIAGYPNKYNVVNPSRPKEDEMPYSTGAWPFVAMWQYTSSAGTLDRDIFYGDRNAWNAYAGIVAKTETKTETKVETKVETKPEVKEEVKEEPKTEQVGATQSEKKQLDNEKVPEQVSTDKGMTPKEYLELLDKVKKSADLTAETAKKFNISFAMNSKVYDILKLIAVAILPAISMLYVGLSNIWGFGLGEQVDATIQLLISIINTILGLVVVKASSDYNKIK